jgi:hypothetical protein
MHYGTLALEAYLQRGGPLSGCLGNGCFPMYPIYISFCPSILFGIDDRSKAP